MIQKAIIALNWKWAFSNNSVNENVFCETLKNLSTSCIHNRRIKIDYRQTKMDNS